jgi:hypothetical protein
MWLRGAAVLSRAVRPARPWPCSSPVAGFAYQKKEADGPRSPTLVTPAMPKGPYEKMSGPAAASFLSTGKAHIRDTLYFSKIAASPSRSDRSQATTFTPDSFSGRVVLVVNTASLCGFTPQLTTMQQVYAKYVGVGLTVLAIPCNDYGQQEPWEETRVKEFYEKVGLPCRLPAAAVEHSAHASPRVRRVALVVVDRRSTVSSSP